MKTSKTGYKSNSKDKNEPALKIPSSNITMQGVPHDVIGVGDNGWLQYMTPGNNYQFGNASNVYEFPVFQSGGQIQEGYRQDDDRTYVPSDLQWGKYITNDKRRDQHIRDVYFGLLDNGWNRKTSELILKDMGAYGSKNRGEEVAKAAYWGWDHADIDSNKTKQWEQEYNNIGKDKMQMGGIHIKKSHEGRFTAYKKRTGKTTEEALHSDDPHVRKMAQFAINASHWKHQMGGPSSQTMTPQQWYDTNTSTGNKLADRYGTGTSYQDEISRGKYPTFYNPKEYNPSEQTGEFTNLKNPGLKQGDGGYNPFIDYQGTASPPASSKPPRAQKVIPDSSRTAISFGNGQTTYRYNDGRVITYDSQGQEVKPVASYKDGGAYRSQIQGKSMDEFLNKKNQKFDDYITNNFMTNLIQSGIKEFQEGGEFEVSGGVNGGTGEISGGAVGSTNESPQSSNPAAGNGGGSNVTQAAKGLKSLTQGLMQAFDPAALFAPINRSIDDYNTWMNEQKLKKWSTIENNIPKSNFGSRGDYDVNSGALKPDRLNPGKYQKGGETSEKIKYKKGGSYDINDYKTLLDLINKGYQIKFE